jgi:DNA-binding response OmpR family regulator
MNPKVLIVDDERTLAETIEYNLQKAGFETVCAYDGEEALKIYKKESPQIVVLDLMLPRLSGWEVCRNLRQQKESSPMILMLTARGEESDKVIGLEMGADDYMVKPFGMRELVARVKVLSRRLADSDGEQIHSADAITIGPISLNPEEHEVYLSNGKKQQEVKLSHKEFELLRVLMSRPGKAFAREVLLEQVWGDDFFGEQRTLDVHIRWLREKLETDPSNPEHILTVRGVGYKIKA